MERLQWQRIFLAVVGVQLAAVLVLLHVLEGNYRPLGIVKYAVICSIFAASRLLPCPTADHQRLAAAVAFLFVGDFFLIFAGTLPGVSPDQTFVKLGGMVNRGAAFDFHSEAAPPSSEKIAAASFVAPRSRPMNDTRDSPSRAAGQTGDDRSDGTRSLPHRAPIPHNRESWPQVNPRVGAVSFSW